MTKIEELEDKASHPTLVGGRFIFSEKELESYKAAIREQVVIEALPSDENVDDAICDYIADTNGEVDSYSLACCVNDVYKKSISTTTREEVERPFVELLKEIKADVTLPVSIWNKLTSLTDGK